LQPAVSGFRANEFARRSAKEKSIVNLELTEEQALLKTTARRFLEERCPESHVRAMEADPLGYDAPLWKAMAELGWHGLMIPEALGGAGMSFFDLAVLTEEMGRVLLPGPFVPNQCVAALLLEAGTEAQRSAYLPQLAAGAAIHTYALAEAAGRWRPDDIALAARADQDGVILSGLKRYVPDGAGADCIWVFARQGGDIVACGVPRDAVGLSIKPLATITGDKQAELALDGVRVERANVVRVAAFERFSNMATVLECAYLVGLTTRDMEITVQYAKDRHQFGRPIGSFQAIQHKAADMVSDVDSMHFLTARAATAVQDEDPSADRIVAMTKAWCSDASRRVVAHGQQIHGGIGFTKEYVIGLYFRRQKRGELFWGAADVHRERVLDMLRI
jgi:alkylation response protein AidB-like acyl-CoA dehydrogenase